MKKNVFILLAVSALMLPGVAQAKSAARFLSDAIKGDNSEIMLGRLARERGASRAVRTFGETLERDHGRARLAAVAAARREHVAVPGTMMAEARAEYDLLRRMSGRSFDREFARYMVQDHRKDVAEFEEQARRGDRTTSRLAAQTLPDLRKHLRMARALK